VLRDYAGGGWCVTTLCKMVGAAGGCKIRMEMIWGALGAVFKILMEWKKLEAVESDFCINLFFRNIV
jgi:hypothetical protein